MTDRFFTYTGIELNSEYEDEFRAIGERYMKLKREIADAEGKMMFSSEEFPVTIDQIEDCGDTILVKGHWTRRGCTDEESCYIPKAILGSDEEREAYFAQMEDRLNAAKGARRKDKETAERAELARLQDKYGATS